MSKLILLVIGKKAKVVLDTSVGFRNWSRSWAFSTQMTEAVNPAVGCLYFLPLQTRGYLSSRRASMPFGRYQIILLGDRGTRVWTTGL